MGCGNGGLVPRNSIHFQVNRTAYKRWLKTQTAHTWSAGRVEFTDSLMEKPNPILSRHLRGSSRPGRYFVIGTAIFGSELFKTAFCTYTRGERMSLLSPMASQAIPYMTYVRIVKGIFG